MTDIKKITQSINSDFDLLENIGNPAYKECCKLIDRLEAIKDKTRRKYFISAIEGVPNIECPNGLQDIHDHLVKYEVMLTSGCVKISQSPFYRHDANLPYDFGERKYHVKYKWGAFETTIPSLHNAGFVNFIE